jgi:hypothetical protein
MALLPQVIADQVALDGLPRAVMADDASQHVLYLEGEVVRSMLAADWLSQRGPLPSVPTQQEIDAAIAAREAARQQALADAAALRQQVLTIAQSAVGVRADLLTAAQLRALFVVILWRDGAIDNALVVRPLAQWVKA